MFPHLLQIKKMLLSRVDRIVFIKKNYSLFKHAIPFAVAAMLLLVLSVPTDNLLLKLAKVLDQPNSLWVPAVLLTIVTGVVYIASIYAQIRQAYLWPEGDRLRAFGTSSLYILLCTVMAYGVLASATAAPLTQGAIWTCLLVALLSLTGIGWSTPGSWVDSVGIQVPDYGSARIQAKRVGDVLVRVRAHPMARKIDVDDFLDAVKKLVAEVDKNLEKEPDWARQGPCEAMDQCKALANATEASFPTAGKSDNDPIQGFQPACKCLNETVYPIFINALRASSKYWREWKC